LEAAVRFAKQDGHDTGQTKKQIEIAAQALASRGIGAEAQLDRYRLERALSLCVDEESVSGLAPKLIDLLRDHPAIRAELDELSATVRGDLERSTRTEVEQRLAREQNAFNETLEAHASTLCELEAAQRQLDEQKKELDALQSKCEKATAEIEAAERQLEQRKGELEALQSKSEQAILEAETAERRLEQWKKELEVLRSNAVTDAAAMVAGSLDPDRASHLHWSNRRGESLRDRAALQRALTDASRKWELSSILVYEV